MGEMATDAAGAPAPRLCHVVKWEDFDGYGFNLHADKSKPGQYIGKVDPGSPSEAAGLKGGDRIVEVNGINIANENHKQVVERIKQFPNETRLFVLDDAADDYCKSMKVVAKSTDANVIHLKTPRSKHGDQDDNEDMPTVRLCHLRKWHDYDGYGFNLQYDQSKQQEFIGSVDADSPAETAGIMEGDRIIAVNGDNIEGESHMQVVQKIKFNPSETRLLVVDTTAFNFYQSRSLKISTSLRDVKYMETPVPRPDSRAANGHTAGQDIEQATERQITIPDPLSEPLAADERHSDDLPTSTSEVEAAVVDHIAAVSVDDDAPSPRLCHLVKWTDFDGYGFNLQYDKHTSTEYIGDVDQGSPADLTAMKKGDRLIEVNDENMERREHADIIRHIKSNANETRLLVADRETYDYYNDKGITITGSMKSVAHHKTPARQPRANGPDVADESEDLPHIRHCTIRKWPDFDGYGFNLVCDVAKAEEFIGNVDKDSPAEAGGLMRGDRVIEVNDVAVEGKTHAEAIELVKQRPLQTSFLVVDQEADKVFTDRGIKIVATLENVERLETPIREAKVSEILAEPESEDLPHIRHCTIRKWPDFDGYGFHLDHHLSKDGECIGIVDAGSPAEAGGLREGDRIIEVNDVALEGKTHAEAIELVKQRPLQVSFLVVDQEADQVFTDKGIKIVATLKNVERLETPERQATVFKVEQEAEAEDDLPPVRLCTIRKWSDYDGYGFNLQYDKGTRQEFIGSVEDGGPAETGGLRGGDRVVEVNGENVEGKGHADVVALVKQHATHAAFLVVDVEADRLFGARGMRVLATLGSVTKMETPLPRPGNVILPRNEDNGIPDSAPRPRLAHVCKWPDFQGYGFNLLADKNGEFLGDIDKDGPADLAGLRKGDRIVEVNGSNIENDSHPQVVNKIKAMPDNTKMLVVDSETDEYYKSRNIAVSGSMDNIDYKKTPASRPASSMRINGDSETRAPAPVSSPAAPPSQADGDVTFNMTASELRARLQSKKKKDPRMSAQLDAKTKSDMLNKL